MGSFSIGNLSGFSNAAAAAAGPAPSLNLQRRALLQAAQTINASGKLGEDNELSVVVNYGGRLPVARIVNRTTGEVIEQIPTQEVLRLAEE